VTDQDNPSQASENEIGYNTSGSVVFTRDPLGHQTNISFTDSFSDGQNDRNTYSYPTTMTDPDNNPPSTVQYNYDFGAVTRTEDPKGAAVTRTYDAAGRIERITNIVNGAYTRYVYRPNQREVETYTTINDLNPANEFRTVTVFDGHDRVRATSSDHPTSVAQYKAQYNVYDTMGRLEQQSNPTEINASWQPAGDDAAGWVWSSQTYDWQGRLTISTDQAGKTKEFLYGGCGCAGGQVVVTRDEIGRRQKMTYDILGRLKTTQTLFIQPKNEPLNGSGAVYSTTTNTCNVRDQVTNVNVKDESSGVSQNTQMVYDGHGRLKERWLPIYLGTPQSATPYDSYEYYSDDTLMRVTDPRGASATYGYNNRHLVTTIVYGAPGGVAATPNVTFAYDEAGNRTSMDDGPGYVSYVYDILSRLQSEARQFDELTGDFQISYTYNLAGQIKTIADNRFNRTATYTYNKAGELTGIAGNGYFGSGQNNFTASSASIWYRASGAIKQLNYGNGLQRSLSYNERLQPTQYRLQTGQSAVLDGSDYQYHDDGRVKFASNMTAFGGLNPANSWDRAYNYDHVGRLAEALSGPEARGESLPPLPGSPNSPYKQVNTYDVWGNLTWRNNRFWRWPIGNSNQYTNNRRQFFTTYDIAGNITIDPTSINTYDAAGRNALSRSNQYGVGGGETGHERMSAFEIGQIYDGDGLPSKRSETRRTEELINGGPQTEITTSVATTYYVRPRALGGQVMLEIEPSGGVVNGSRSYIYAGNERIADYSSFSGGGQTFTNIEWRHSNPVTGTATKTLVDGVPIDRKEFDPLGAEVGNHDPYFDIPDFELLNYLDWKGDEPLYIDGGDPLDLSGGCALDGMPISCNRLLHMIEVGAVQGVGSNGIPVEIMHLGGGAIYGEKASRRPDGEGGFDIVYKDDFLGLLAFDPLPGFNQDKIKVIDKALTKGAELLQTSDCKNGLANAFAQSNVTITDVDKAFNRLKARPDSATSSQGYNIFYAEKSTDPQVQQFLQTEKGKGSGGFIYGQNVMLRDTFFGASGAKKISPDISRAIALIHEAVHLAGLGDAFFGGSAKLNDIIIKACWVKLYGHNDLTFIVQ
jgi:YD repeat-containing protein